MADASITTPTPDNSLGKPVDVETVTTGVGTVNRQVVAIGDPAAGGTRATVTTTGLEVDPYAGANLTQSGTLGALNATVALAIQGRPSVGFAILNSQSFTGSLVLEISTDNGGHWDSRIFWNGDAFVVADVLPNGNGINVRE